MFIHFYFYHYQKIDVKKQMTEKKDDSRFYHSNKKLWRNRIQQTYIY